MRRSDASYRHKTERRSKQAVAGSSGASEAKRWQRRGGGAPRQTKNADTTPVATRKPVSGRKKKAREPEPPGLSPD